MLSPILVDTGDISQLRSNLGAHLHRVHCSLPKGIRAELGEVQSPVDAPEEEPYLLWGSQGRLPGGGDFGIGDPGDEESQSGRD